MSAKRASQPSGSDAGRVGYLAVGGKLVPVRVEGPEGGRLRTVGRDGTARVIAPARLYWLGDERVPDEAALGRYWQAVVKRARDCDLEMAWRLLADDGGLVDTTPRELAELTPGGDSPEDVDGLAVAVFSDPLYFKLKGGRVQPTSRERLDQLVREREAAEQAARELEIAARALEARLDAPASASEAAADDAAVARHVAALVDLAVFGQEAGDVTVATELMERLGLPRRGDPPRRAFDLLVRLGVFEPDENLFVRQAGVPTAFARDVLEEADRLAAMPPDQVRPLDLTGLLTVAIDDARTTEVDDAFAVEGGRLHVFIADAAAFVPRDSAVHAEALRRASTLYLPRGKVPMMPPVLAEDAASLLEGRVRPALDFSAEVDEQGRLLVLEIREATIRVDRRLTYDDVDAMLAAPDAGGDAVAELVRTAGAWMDRHREARARRGALLLQRSEVDIQVAPGGEVLLTRVNANGPARQLVSEMMVAVGAAVAQWCQENQVPCVFRAQPPPDQPIDWDLGEVEGPADQVAILRRLKPSALTTHAKPHFTLGLSAYTQITSPLRRYQDLLMHHQLKAMVQRKRPALTAGHLMQAFDAVERQAALLRRIEADTRRFWTLRYLEQQPRRDWEAVVVRELNRRWQVEITDLAFQTLVVPSRRLLPGETITLRVAEVDARRDHLVLVEA